MPSSASFPEFSDSPAATPQGSPLPAGAIDPAKLSLDASRSFVDWLLQQRLSLALTTYQSNRLILVGVKPEGRLSSVVRSFDRAMGLWATPDLLYLTSRHQLWRLSNPLQPGEQWRGHDRLYVPRLCYWTGEIDAHDLVVDATGRPVFSGCVVDVQTNQTITLTAGSALTRRHTAQGARPPPCPQSFPNLPSGSNALNSRVHQQTDSPN